LTPAHSIAVVIAKKTRHRTLWASFQLL